MVPDLSTSSVGVSFVFALLHFSVVLLPTVEAVPIQVQSVEVGPDAEVEMSSAWEDKSIMRRDVMTPRSEGSDMTGATPSRGALMKRRGRTVIPGHIALPSIMEVSYAGQEGAMTFSCTQVYGKARDITQAYKAVRLREAKASGVAADLSSVTSPSGWVNRLEDRILKQSKGWDLVADFGKVLDNIDLSQGLEHGKVWTITDATVWADCNSNQSTVDSTGQDILEVHTSINGDPLEQGDEMIAFSSDSSALLEATVKQLRAVSNLWPLTSDTAEIPYCFASTISDEAKEAFVAAVTHIEEQVPCVRFNPTSSIKGTNEFSQTVQENCDKMPSVIVQSSEAGCWSLVGLVSNVGRYSGSSQSINIGKGCGDMGIAAHEIGHSIGMLHEMSRADRDKWVTINSENIKEAFSRNFNSDSRADQSSAFDFLSLMMYGSYSFSTNGDLTIEPHDVRLVNFMGQRMGFSELDVELIGNMYGCVDKIAPKTRNKHLSEAYLNSNDINTGFEGVCKDSPKTGYVRSDDSPMPCSELKRYCAHDTLGSEIRKLCPVSCYMCEPGLDNTEATTQNTAKSTGDQAASDKPLWASQQNSAKSTFLISGLLAAWVSLVLA